MENREFVLSMIIFAIVALSVVRLVLQHQSRKLKQKGGDRK